MNDISDTFPLTNDLLKPWSMPALVLTALLLMGAAAWSYLRAPGGKRYRVGVVLGIRLVALILVFLALSGTSCVNRDELKVPSILLVGVDASESMSAVKDEVGRVSRWEHLSRSSSSSSATRSPSSTPTTPARPMASGPIPHRCYVSSLTSTVASATCVAW